VTFEKNTIQFITTGIPVVSTYQDDVRGDGCKSILETVMYYTSTSNY
jgi:hypothetical protein